MLIILSYFEYFMIIIIFLGEIPIEYEEYSIFSAFITKMMVQTFNFYLSNKKIGNFNTL